MSDKLDRYFWLVAVPNTKPGIFEVHQKRTEGLCANYRFPIASELRVGTLDALMTLSDDLQRIDTFVEGTVRKIGKNFYELVEKAEPMVKQATLEHYLTHFQWDEAKYPVRNSIKDLVAQISQEVSKLDEELRAKLAEYNQVSQSIIAAERRTGGNLLVRSLHDIVTDSIWFESEYLTTLFVVVPKHMIKDWTQQYERITDHVVPRSTTQVAEDSEYALMTVRLFRKAVDEFKNLAREKRFVVRDFNYAASKTEGDGVSEIKKFEQNKEELQRKLVLWCKVNFAEAFIAWVHLKSIRIFVESVLRFGLPVNFVAILMQLKKSNESKVRSALSSLYSGLGGAGMSQKGGGDEEEEEKFYPYVFLALDLQFKATS